MKKKYFPYFILILIGLLAVLFGTKSDALFGSTVDWFNQHTVFPDYFRSLFYETGNLFPNFAPHLGAGQNIFNFAYYGLYNPLILLSYLFKAVPMVTYLEVMSIVGYCATGCLCYQWLKRHFDEKTSFCGACFGQFAVPLLFHAHRHLMFVTYMPFLFLALIGVDRHFNGKSGLLMVSILAMILTSYYYSVGGLLVIVIYGVYRFLSMEEKVTFQSFLKAGIRFLIPLLLGIFLASGLLLPVFSTMLQNHTRVNSTVTFSSLLIPKLNLNGILYGSYALGLTGIVVIALLYLFPKKKKNTLFLGFVLISILSFPLFRYLLNGALYIKNKALIPFIPLFLYTLCIFFSTYLKEKRRTWITLLALVFLGFYFTFLGHSFQNYLWDFLVCVALILLSFVFQKRFLVTVPLLIACFVLTVGSSRSDNFVTKESYQNLEIPTITDLIKETSLWERTNVLMNTGENINRIYPSYGTSIYSSTYNSDYHAFYKDTMSLAMPHRNILMNANSKNFLFDTYMGVHNLIHVEEVPSGYQIQAEKNGIFLSQNDQVYPIGYARSQLLNNEDFLKLSDAERMEALFAGIITEHGTDEISFTQMKKDLLGAFPKQENIIITKKENQWIFEVKEKTTVVIPLKEVLERQVLLLQFDLLKKPECRDGDIAIEINGISNKLTCRQWGYNNENTTFHYVIAEDLLGTLTMTFTKGTYYLSNLEMSTLDQTTITDSIKELDPWKLNTKKSMGDQLVGTIQVREDGYFATSIPYDSGFTAYVDGEKVEIEKVNTAFLGFPIRKGNHIVKLVYQSPLALEGRLLTSLAFLGAIGMIYFEFRYRKGKRK